MLKPIEKTPIWPCVKKILDNPDTDTRYEFKATIHTPTDNIEVMKVITFDICRDFLGRIADYCNIEIIMPFGDYVKRFYPYKENCELSLHRVSLNELAESVRRNKPANTERYKVMFLPESNKAINGTEFINIDKFTLDLSEITTVKLQLANRAAEPWRIKTVYGVYSNTTAKELLHSTVGAQSRKVLVDGKPAIDSVDIIEPDNEEPIQQVVIPQEMKLSALPTFLQEKGTGIYNSGIGTYLMRYNGKTTVFVYPLFNPTLFDRKGTKLVIYVVPKDRYMGIERTYRKEADTIYAIATSEKSITDSGETDFMNKGNGFRLTDARPMMLKPVEMTTDGPVGVSNKINHEVAIKNRSDNLNYAPVSHNDISANPFADYSRVSQHDGMRLQLEWQHSDPRVIYPAMPVTYVYLENDKIKKLKGIVLFAHSTCALDGKGVMATSHLTSTMLNIFVK